uniref:Neurogenic locus Notch protein n=1 Tax=Parastrongyloides trichosuri TaxID=131310 RepID=A0A0N4ZTI2_PARTI
MVFYTFTYRVIQEKFILSEKICNANVCFNGGTCIIDESNLIFTCKCQPNFSGTLCENENACILNCGDNGECRHTSEGVEYCECKESFEGTLCDVKSDSCTNNKCSENSICVSEDDQYVCHCNNGWYGEFCDIDVDECQFEPCKNNGTCVNLPGEYKCECLNGFSGSVCEKEPQSQCVCENPLHVCIKDSDGHVECKCDNGNEGENCDVVPKTCQTRGCENGGNCITNDTNNKTFCICPSNFVGQYCETYKGECLVEGKECQNNGTCKISTAGSFCDCTPKYSGKHCETLNFNSLNTPRPASSSEKCHDDYCKNNGKCMEIRGDNPKCICSQSWTGDFCEISITKTTKLCEPNFCLNDGICSVKDNDPECSCTPNFVGTNCQIQCNCDIINEACIEDNSNKKGFICISVNEDFTKEIPHITLVNEENTNLIPTTTIIPNNITNFNSLTTTIPRLELSTDGNTNTSSSTILPLNINNINDCDECQNESKCKVADGRKICICDKNFKGKYCEQKNDLCDNVQCKDGQICNVKRTVEGNEETFCSCSDGFHGGNCLHDSTVTFKNSSLFLYQSKDFVSGLSQNLPYDLSFEFRTTIPDTLLILGENILAQTQYYIFLKNGRLIFQLLETQYALLSDIQLNDGEWYRIEMNKKENKVTLQVYNSKHYSLLKKTFTVPSWNLFTTRMGKKVFSRKTKADHFVGCIRNLKIGNENVNLKDSTKSVDIFEGCLKTDQCIDKPCQNGADCYDLWDKFSCQCHRPFLPPFCIKAYSEVTFGHENKPTMVKYTLESKDSDSVKQSTDISFIIRTTKENANILYIGENGDEDVGTFISTEIINGNLGIRCRLGGKQIFSKIGTTNLIKNGSHLIEILRENNNIQVLIDNKPEFSIFIDRPFPHPLLVDSIVIGDDSEVRNDAFTHSGALLKATLQDVRINENMILLQDSPLDDTDIPIIGTKVFEQNLLQGTISDDICNELKPCVKGKCENTFNNYVCVCEEGWTGKNCSFEDYCLHNTCIEGTKCLPTDPGFICVGPTSFYETSKTNFVLNVPKDLKFDKYKDLSIKIEFKTTKKDGHIGTFLYKNKSIGLYITNEMLSISQNNSDHEFRESINYRISDGHTHTIHIEEKENGLFTYVDKRESIQVGGNFKLLEFFQDSTSQINFGYIPIIGGFSGCMNYISLGSLPPISFVKNGNSTKSLQGSYYFKPDVIENVNFNECEVYDICLTSSCKNNGKCLADLLGQTYSCQCKNGFSGKYCEEKVKLCTTNDTYCSSNGECYDDGIKKYCQCKQGYKGEKCDIKINKCDEKPCMNGAECENLPGGKYLCKCVQNFVGRNCQIRKNSTCSVNPCEKGKCTDLSTSSFECSCSEGIEGILCDTQINYCTENPCKNGGSCVNGEKNYTCECREGYGGKDCSEFKDTCKLENPCEHGKCKNIWNGFQCSCDKGWTSDKCDIDINECKNMPCWHNGICHNINGSFTCECENSYLGDTCNIEGSCLSNPCVHGDCRQLTKDNHECFCHKGFKGENCSIQINFCENNPCHNGATCENVIGDYKCHCLPGFSKHDCSEDIDECKSHPCKNNGKCTDRINSFECECRNTGFKGLTCEEDINECTEIKNSCIKGKCENLNGGYKCECEHGYIGSKCNQLDPCLISSSNSTTFCINGICVNPHVITFENGTEIATNDCQCNEGFEGLLCDKRTEKFGHLPLPYIISILIVLFLVAFILLTTLCCFICKAKRTYHGHYSPSTQENIGSKVQMNTMALKRAPPERLI